MIRIDSHQHFWTYDPVAHSWINDDMAVIRRDFLPEHLAPTVEENQVEGCIAVQAEHTNMENDFLVEMSGKNDFIKGIVGWTDLQHPDVAERLHELASIPIIKGIRHILQGEPQRDLMLENSFLNGIKHLEEVDFTYDILVSSDQLQFIPEFVSSFPHQRFVLDHIGKPGIKNGEILRWEKDIKLLARQENVYCKISGLLTEANLKEWKKEDFTPYLDVVVEAFGIKRIMYGSDWPVCLAAGSYKENLDVVKSYFSSFSADEQQLFFWRKRSRLLPFINDDTDLCTACSIWPARIGRS